MAYVLWQRHLRHNPRDPHWPDRDRFVLSAGHGCVLLYSLLHLTGYDLTLDDLKAFRQWGSRTPGHPELHLTPGVEATTGPLGQGTANAVGMAIAERFLAARFNRPGPRDREPPHLRARLRRRPDGGDLVGGRLARRPPEARQARLPLRRQPRLARRADVAVVHRGRAAPLRGLRLAGPARRERQHRPRRDRRRDPRRPSPQEDRPTHHRRAHDDRLRLAAQGGNVRRARQPARRRGGRADQEGARLGVDGAVPRAARGRSQALPDGGRARHAPPRANGSAASPAWATAYPGSRRGVADGAQGRPPGGLGRRTCRRGRRASRSRPASPAARRSTRSPNTFRGSSAATPTSPSRRRRRSSRRATSTARPATGNNIHYGVREHAMAAIANGLCYHGGVRPFVATFFCFSDYMRPAIRLAALEPAADDLRLDARLDRPRRGRPDAPGRRAPDVAPRRCRS